VRYTAKASPARPTWTRLTGSRFGVLVALIAALAATFVGTASADPLGEATVCPKEGLRETGWVRNATKGPDGNVWFIDSGLFTGAPAIGRVTSSCAIAEYVSGTNLSGLGLESDLISITAAPKGEKYLWFTDRGATPAVGYVDSASPESATEISAKLNAGSKPEGIVAGPDGNLWFTDDGTTPAIGVVDPISKEVVKECSAGLNAESKPEGIVAGPDGNLWFVDSGATRAIGKVNPSTCEITEFPTGANSEPGGGASSGTWGIGAGADGNVWFSESGTNEVNGTGVCRITTSGTITCFKTGLIADSGPTAMTTAADSKGRLWFVDNTVGAKEEQELTVEAGENLGGTYKLGFKGKETGWVGTGSINGFVGTGDVKRSPASGTANCTRTSASKELKSCAASLVEGSTKVEPGMRISGTGLAAKTMVEKVEGTTIFITIAATSSGTSGVSAGWIRNVSYTSGKAEVGKLVAGTGVSTAGTEVIAVGELEGKGTITPTTVPTAAGTGVALTGGSKTISSVTTSSGCPTKGEAVSGAGIPAGTTISAAPSSCEPTSITISNFPTETATGVSLSADLPYNASASTIQGALEKLSTIGESNVSVESTSETSPIKRVIRFEGALHHSNLEQMTCNGAGLTGTAAACKVETLKDGVPNAIASIKTSGEEHPITRYPNEGDFVWEGFPITNGPGGNVWFGLGLLQFQRIGKLGIEDAKPVNRRTITLTKTPAGNAGAGLGTVSSKPKGIKCAQYCNEAVGHLYKNQAVVLTAAPSGETSAFDKWVGCPSAVGLVCTIPADKADYEVEAVFKGTSKAFSPAEPLTFSKGNSEQNFGWGTVKASGLTCEADCEGTTVLYLGPTTKPGKTVILKEIPAFGSTFVAWSGCTPISETECKVEMSEAKSVTAEFEDLPDFALTVEKAYAGGLGTVSSKPKGISCATTCTQAVASMPKGASVLLTAKPASTEPATTFKEWVNPGGDCNGSTSPTCTVGMDKAETLKAVFSGPVKTIVEPKSLTLTKEGSGYGTVKAAGLTCEVLCTSATSLYYGPVTSPKVKAGAKVTLKAISAPGSTAVSWTGCESNPTPSECVVVMETNKSVSAKFDELE
jgi:streptogramin lyase